MEDKRVGLDMKWIVNVRHTQMKLWHVYICIIIQRQSRSMVMWNLLGWFIVSFPICDAFPVFYNEDKYLSMVTSFISFPYFLPHRMRELQSCLLYKSIISNQAYVYFSFQFLEKRIRAWWRKYIKPNIIPDGLGCKENLNCPLQFIIHSAAKANRHGI